MKRRRRPRITAAVLGHRIAAARRRAEFTMVELARLIGCTHSAVSRFESGACYPSVETLDAIARACGVEPSTFWDAKEHAA